MVNVNQIASWFNENNVILRDSKFDNHLLFMCLLTKVAFHIKNIEVSYGKATFENGYLNFSEYLDKNAQYEFNEKETHILKSINKYYGYYTFDNLISNHWISQLLINIEEKTKISDVMLYANLTHTVSQALQFYQNSSLDEYVIIEKDKIFFVQKDINLTEDEMKLIKEVKTTEQMIFDVFCDEDGLVIM